ncbi:MAG TPA: glycoside hydrolase domain-containing protein [Actinomycetota bacterium]|nr:glycoside hydrolase domain-containing protein [Actinomycetota bacterium]
MPYVVDYSWARPAPADLKAAGYIGAMRYLSYETGKNLSPAERDRLFAQGIACGLVWETSAGRPLAGYAAGQQDAREANRQADALGWPGHIALAYAVDFGPRSDQLPAIRDYFRGCKSIPGRPVAMYGTYAVVEDLARWEPVHCYWQCAGWSGSGSGSGGSMEGRRLSAHACLYQWVGGKRILPADSTDHNEGTGHDPSGLVALLYHPDLKNPEPEPPEEDEMPRQIVWCKPDSQWMVDVGGFPPGSGPHGFVAEGAKVLHLPDVDAVQWERFAIMVSGGVVDPDRNVAAGTPNVREHWDVPDVIFRDWTLDGPGGVSNHPHNQKSPPPAPIDIPALAAAISAELVAAGIETTVSPADVDAIARRTVELFGHELAD